MKKYFKPEFLNRLDDVIMFNKLSKKDIEGIIQIQLNNLSNRLKELDYTINFDKSNIDKILQRAYDENFGARPIRRFIQKHIENDISKQILEGKIVKEKPYNYIMKE